MAKEIELKLLCDEAFSFDALLTQLKSITTLTPVKKGDNVDTYLDTKSRCIARAGLSARLRNKGGKKNLDIKSIPLIPELIMSREEHSYPLKARENSSRALKKWMESTWPIQLKGEVSSLFVLKSQRQKFIIETSAYKAELSFDHSTAIGPGETTGPSFRELECEFLSGDTGAFQFVCEVMRQNPGLTTSQISKFERASQMLGVDFPDYAPPKPQFTALDTRDEVARRICVNQYQTMRGYEPGTRVGLDLEHLHKMRVAVRRLRNALSIFGDCFDQRRLNALKDQYRWIADVLGVVRDLDVQQLNQNQWQSFLGHEPKAGWDQLRQTLSDRWLAGRKEMIKALDSARYRSLCERSESLFKTKPRRAANHPGRQVLATLGASTIHKRTKNFRRRIKTVRAVGTAEVLHELRIEGKKLRYTTEFFKPIFKGNVKKDIAKLSDFQEKLGEFNDNCVTADFAAKLRDEALSECPDAGAYLYVLGQLYGWMTLSSHTAQRECEEALKTLGGRKITEKLDALAQLMVQSTLKKQKRRGRRS